LKHLFLVLIIAAYLFIPLSFANAESSEGRYTVKIGDVLNIRVINYSGLNTIAQVAVDGTITFPYIGDLYVKGMKISEIEKEITQRLGEGYLEYPVVSVSLVKAVSDTYLVYGEVASPGTYTLDRDTTVIRAIALAKGITKGGYYGKVKVRRKREGKLGYEDIEIDRKGIIEGSATADILLQPDDILIVEPNKTFFVQGEVRKPGQYTLEDGMTVTRAITIAGGIKESGLYGKVKVRRKREGQPGYKDIEIDLKGIIEGSATGDILLQPDDIVIVERNKTFFILGEVERPGQHVLEDGMTVTRAITVAGGIKEGGLHGKVKVRRKREGQPGYKDIEIDLKGIIEGSATGDILLQPDDIVIVERNKTFLVYGEVGKPGEYVLEEDMTVFKAIVLAGGITQWGSLKNVKVLRRKEDKTGFEMIKVNINNVLEGDATADVILQPGDIVIVPMGGIF
jgi:polysaccharide export outer membrane protein